MAALKGLMMTIQHINIEVTRRCNQRCFYCFNESSAAGEETPFSPEQWLRALSRLQHRGLRSIHITGGEPFCWGGTVELLRGAQAFGLRTSILSNGHRIPELAASDADPFRRLAVAQISLDAMTPAVHDARRGTPGAWRKAMRAVEALRGLQVPIELSAVVSRENLDEVSRLANLCVGIGARLLVRRLLPLGRASKLGAADTLGEALERQLEFAGRQCPGVIAADRFYYLPSGGQDGQLRPRGHIATVFTNGMLRSDWALTAGAQDNEIARFLRAA